MGWMLAHPWMVFWLVALAIMHRTMQTIAEVEKMKMEGK